MKTDSPHQRYQVRCDQEDSHDQQDFVFHFAADLLSSPFSLFPLKFSECLCICVLLLHAVQRLLEVRPETTRQTQLIDDHVAQVFVVLLQLNLAHFLFKRQHLKAFVFGRVDTDFLLSFLQFVRAFQNLADEACDLTSQIDYFLASSLSFPNSCAQSFDTLDCTCDKSKSADRVNLRLTG